MEVDGGQHNENAHLARDRARDGQLANEGFKVLRFWNSDVDENLEGILESIDQEISERTPTRPRASARGHPPPLAGEG